MRSYLIAAAMLIALSAPAAADPIATTDGDVPGQRIEVTELKRGSGDTLTLKLTVINESKQDIGTNTFYDPKVGGDYYTAGGISLVDAANKQPSSSANPRSCAHCAGSRRSRTGH